MNVRELLAQKDAFFGKEITVEGFLVEKAPEYVLYLAPDDETRDDVSNSIRVELSNLREQFEERLPSWVGTKYKHVDPAKLTGILVSSDDGVFPAMIAHLTKFTAKQHDEVIDVLSEP